MTTYTFGIIGCQHSHIAGFIKEMQALGHSCAGIYEADNHELAQTIADRCNVPICHQLEQLLRPEIDMIGCASMNHKKIDIIELCELHGKPIMLDKPIVINRQDYERL